MRSSTIHKWKDKGKFHIVNLVRFFENRPRLTMGLFLFMVLGFFITGLRIVDEPESFSGLELLEYSSKSDYDDYYQASVRFKDHAPDPYRILNLQKARLIMEKNSGNLAGLVQALPLLKGVGSYLYPPLTAFMLTPFLHLSYTLAAVLYLIVATFLFTVWSFMAMHFASHEGISRNKSLGIYFLSCLMLWFFLNSNAGNGNIGFLLIFLCGVGLLLAFSGMAIMEFGGGFLIGIAAVMKITPIFLGGVLFAGRRLFALAGLLVGVGTGIIIPGFYYGHEQNLQWLMDWYILVIDSFQDMVFIRSWMNNQSLGAMLGRFFLEGQEVKQATFGLPIQILPEMQGPERITFFAGIVRALNVLIFAILAVASSCMFFRNGIRRAFLEGVRLEKPGIDLLDTQMVRLIMMIMIASLLMAGVSWYHTWGFLIIGVFLWFLAIEQGNFAHSAGHGIFVVLFFYGVIYQVLPSMIKDLLSVFSFFTIAMLMGFLWLSKEFFQEYVRSLFVDKGA